MSKQSNERRNELKPYLIPEPMVEPHKALVIYYKVVKGFEYDDRNWDKIHFKRAMKSAVQLLEVCKTYEEAKKCLNELSLNFENSELSWTFETVVKHSHDWMLKRSKRNDDKTRKRFFDALALQRTNTECAIEGALVTGGQILATLGNLEVLRNHDRSETGSGDIENGTTGKRIQPSGMEKKTA